MKTIAISSGGTNGTLLTGSQVEIIISSLRSQRELTREMHVKLCKEPNMVVCIALVKHISDITIIETALHNIAG